MNVHIVYPRGTRKMREEVVGETVHRYTPERNATHTRCGLWVNDDLPPRRRTVATDRELTCGQCRRLA